MKTAAALLLFLFVSAVNAGEIVRNAAAVHQFKATHICPSTKAYSQKCPGHVVDHKEPLCAGGKDIPANMQYQTVEAGLQKDKIEWEYCRLLKKYNALQVSRNRTAS